MKLTNDVIEVLKKISVTLKDKTFLLYLPPGQLDRKLYTKVNEVLEELGGKWKGGKVKAHIFDKDPRGKLADACSNGSIVTAKDEDFYPTPKDVAATLVQKAVEYLDISKPWSFLEPSAGKGDITYCVPYQGCESFTLVELNKDRAEYLKERFKGFDKVAVFEANFLECKPLIQKEFDMIIMNPPFSGNQAPKHILHAWSMIKSGGVLGAIMPPNAETKEQKVYLELQDKVMVHRKWSQELPEGTFKESGTMIKTMMFVAVKS